MSVVNLLLTMLPFLAWILIFGLLRSRSLRRGDAFLLASLLWGAYLVLGTEFLSLFRALTLPGVSAFWGLSVVILTLAAWHTRWLSPFRWVKKVQGIRQKRFDIGNWSPDELILGGVVVAFLAGTLLVACNAPPNTNDALQYHLSRVAHWAQQGSLTHFATPIPRQVWMPPGAEMVLLHLYLLGRGDWFANLVQWLALVGCLVTVAEIARLLGARRRGRWLAMAFCVTVPMVVMQASSAKNDIVMAFWVLCLAYFTLLLSQRYLTRLEWLGAGLAVSLGLLTKGTFVAFGLPFLAWMGFSVLRRRAWKQAITYTTLGLFLVLLLNTGSWMRNYHTYGTFLGSPEDVAAHANADYHPTVVLSNLLLNMALHLPLPFGEAVNLRIEDAFRAASHALGVEANPDFAMISLWRSEDFAGNPAHLLLIVGLTLLLCWPHTRAKWQSLGLCRGYGLAVWMSLLLFSALYLWQPFGSRLQVSFFVLWSSLTGVIVERWRFAWLRGLVLVPLIVSGLLALVFNQSRPLIGWQGASNIFQQSRQELRFANVRWAYDGYTQAGEVLQASGCRQIGLMVDSHDPEYNLWVLSAPSGSDIHLEHLNAYPPLDDYTVTDFQPCALACTYCDVEKGQEFGLPQVILLDGVILFLP